MSNHELAQLNIALMTAPMDSPQLEDFVDNLDRINRLAEESPGFVWRLQTEEGNATALRPFGEQYLVNLSVWRDVESLYEYVYRSAHVEILKRRKEWFAHVKDAHSVLWWVPEGHRPSVAEAKARLDLLQVNGPTRDAFTFKTAYPSPQSNEKHGEPSALGGSFRSKRADLPLDRSESVSVVEE